MIAKEQGRNGLITTLEYGTRGDELTPGSFFYYLMTLLYEVSERIPEAQESPCAYRLTRDYLVEVLLSSAHLVDEMNIGNFLNAIGYIFIYSENLGEERLDRLVNLLIERATVDIGHKVFVDTISPPRGGTYSKYYYNLSISSSFLSALTAGLQRLAGLPDDDILLHKPLISKINGFIGDFIGDSLAEEEVRIRKYLMDVIVTPDESERIESYLTKYGDSDETIRIEAQIKIIKVRIYIQNISNKIERIELESALDRRIGELEMDVLKTKTQLQKVTNEAEAEILNFNNMELLRKDQYQGILTTLEQFSGRHRPGAGRVDSPDSSEDVLSDEIQCPDHEAVGHIPNPAPDWTLDYPCPASTVARSRVVSAELKNAHNNCTTLADTLEQSERMGVQLSESTEYDCDKWHLLYLGECAYTSIMHSQGTIGEATSPRNPTFHESEEWIDSDTNPEPPALASQTCSQAHTDTSFPEPDIMGIYEHSEGFAISDGEISEYSSHRSPDESRDSHHSHESSSGDSSTWHGYESGRDGDGWTRRYINR